MPASASRAGPRPATLANGSPYRRDDPGEAGEDQGVGAGGGLAVVAARFEGDEQRRTPRRLARGLERDDLGMRPAEPRVMADSDHLAIPDDDGADHWVRLDGAQPAGGLGEGPPHPHLRVDRRVRAHQKGAGTPGVVVAGLAAGLALAAAGSGLGGRTIS